jgi:sec-independent protein translocase protein TatC
MSSPEEPKGAPAPTGETVPGNGQPAEPSPAAAATPSYGDYEDPYGYQEGPERSAAVQAAALSEQPGEPLSQPAATGGGNGGSSQPPEDSEPDEDDGMLRMSFLEHLQELRTRIFSMLAGIGIAFVLSLTFANQLWLIVQKPAEEALRNLGINPPKLVIISPMESFNIVWVKLPILVAIFLASPWILYQIWGFIAPGLYKRERRWAAPFIVCSAGLFIAGGLFAYFVAFRYGLTFLLGIGRDVNIMPMVSVNEYFDLFFNVVIGVGLVFELPILVFFLTLLRVVSPKFLIDNSRYAILAIVIIAAIVTPTPDVFNLVLFATPMVLLFYVGILASYLLVLQREGRRFPWMKVLVAAALVLAALAGFAYLAVTRYGYRLTIEWPFLVR